MGCNGALRVQRKLPVVFVPLPLAPCGNVRLIFFYYLAQMSASVFGPSKSQLRLAVCVMFLESLENRIVFS